MHFVYTEISNDYNFFRLKDEIFFQKSFWILDSLVLGRSCKKNWSLRSSKTHRRMDGRADRHTPLHPFPMLWWMGELTDKEKMGWTYATHRQTNRLTYSHCNINLQYLHVPWHPSAHIAISHSGPDQPSEQLHSPKQEKNLVWPFLK